MADSRNLKRGLAAAAFAFALDQASKQALLDLLQYDIRAELELLPFFNLVLVWNRGVSFGLFSSHDQRWALILLSLVVCAVLLRWMARTPSALVAFATGLVVGGALGNVADRLRFGAVADFFDFHLAGMHWPAFNIADSCIFIGVVVLCIHSMFMEPDPKDPTP